MLTDPMMGSCDNDTVMFSNVDPVSASTVPPALCGMLSGQESKNSKTYFNRNLSKQKIFSSNNDKNIFLVYVYVKNTDSATNVLFNIASMTSSSKWKIRVEQIACASEMLAPPGCLTYAMTTSGSIQSYNIAGGSGEMINNQKFSHCIKYQEGFCDIAFTASTFDLDPEDSLTIGSNVNSGSTFGVSNMLTRKLGNIFRYSKIFHSKLFQ